MLSRFPRGGALDWNDEEEEEDGENGKAFSRTGLDWAGSSVIMCV